MLFAAFLSSCLALQEPPAQPPSAQAPERMLLLQGATVHSMVAGESPRRTNVLIEGDRIRALGDELVEDPRVEVLSLSGLHVFPGLIDAHVNFDPEHDALYLSAGVTTVRDIGGDHAMLSREREPAQRERGPGPTLLTAGAALDGDPPISSTAVILRNAHAAEEYLPILFEEQVDFLSVLPGLPEEAWRKALELAHGKGLTVYGPRPRELSLAAAIQAGQDGFHGLDALLPLSVYWDFVQLPALDEGIAALAETRRPLIPLFEASALRLRDQGTDERVLQLFGLLAPSYESWWRADLTARKQILNEERLRTGERLLEKQARALKSLFDASVRLLPGSGAPQPWILPGHGLHQELAQWVQVGLPPLTVLELATRGAAECLGLSGERGTIQVGALADLVVVSADASEDLARLANPEWVFVRGRGLARADLEAGLAALAERQSQLRAALAREIQVAAPPTPEDGVVILEGTAESESFGTRLESERYRVVRLPDERLLFTGRVVYPAATEQDAREMTVEQTVQNGELIEARVTLKERESVLEYRGIWTANSWRMQTLLDGKPVNTPKPAREHPVCLDVGSVTSLLVVAQAALAERLPVVRLFAGLDAQLEAWRSEQDQHGDHQIRTPIGQRAFRLDERGALVFALLRVGASSVSTRGLSSDSFGGPGLPLPLAKRAKAPAEPAPTPAGSPRSEGSGETGG